MSHLFNLLLLNHSVVSQGKLVGFMAVSDYRAGSYWV